MKHPLWRRSLICFITILQAVLLGMLLIHNHIHVAYTWQDAQKLLQAMQEAAYPTQEAAKQATPDEILTILEHVILTLVTIVIIISLIIPVILAIIGLLSGIPVAIVQAILICMKAYETETAVPTNTSSQEDEDSATSWGY